MSVMLLEALLVLLENQETEARLADRGCQERRETLDLWEMLEIPGRLDTRA